MRIKMIGNELQNDTQLHVTVSFTIIINKKNIYTFQTMLFDPLNR